MPDNFQQFLIAPGLAALMSFGLTGCGQAETGTTGIGSRPAEIIKTAEATVDAAMENLEAAAEVTADKP